MNELYLLKTLLINTKALYAEKVMPAKYIEKFSLDFSKTRAMPSRAINISS